MFCSRDDEGTAITRSSTDDFAIAATPIERMAKFKVDLGTHFEMSDLGELAGILGIRVECNRLSRSI